MARIHTLNRSHPLRHSRFSLDTKTWQLRYANFLRLMSPPLALLKLLAGNCSLLFSRERLFNDINGYELMDSPSRGKRGSSREPGRLATIIKTNSSWLILQPSSSSPSSPLIALYLNLYHNNVTLPRIYVYTRAIFFFFFFLARCPPLTTSSPTPVVSRRKVGKVQHGEFVFSHTRTWCYRVNRKMAYFVEHDAPGSDANRSRNYDQRESCLEMDKVCSRLLAREI